MIARRAAIVLVLSGCTMGPKYHRPAAGVPTASSYAAASAAPGESWKVATPSDAKLRGKWWKMFNEPELDALEERLNVDNQSLKVSLELYMAARAQIRVAQAGYAPTVSVGATASTGQTGSQKITSFSLPAQISWAPDLFGRVRSNVHQLEFGAQASAADLESQRLLLQAALAQTFFQTRGQDALEELLEATVQADTRIVTITRGLYQTGIGTEVAVVQSEQTLQTARVQLTNVGIARAQFRHAIATLIGVPATSFSLPKRALLATPPPIPTGAPSELLERRPDIAAAERRMAQANAIIGLGYAAYYPSLTLSGTGGLASAAVGTLFTSPTFFWSVGAAATETVFNGGAREATVRQLKAQYNASVASYRQTVLAAFQQVEDVLSQTTILSKSVAEQKIAVELAQKAFDLEKVRYETGVDPYLNLMTAQTTLLSAQQTLVSLQVQQMTSSVFLVEALGGGWDRADLPGPSKVSEQPK